jgi:hypothetical protein
LFVCRHNGFCTIIFVLVDRIDPSEILKQRSLVQNKGGEGSVLTRCFCTQRVYCSFVFDELLRNIYFRKMPSVIM